MSGHHENRRANRRPRWRIDLEPPSPSILNALAKLGFQQKNGVWQRPIWTERQGRFIIDQCVKLGAHGKPVVLARERRRHHAEIREINKRKEARVAAQAPHRAEQLQRDEERRLSRDAYLRAECALRRTHA